MTSPVDPEKAEELQPLLVEVSSDDSVISASDVPKVDNKRRFWFIVGYISCVLFVLWIFVPTSVDKLGTPGCRRVEQGQVPVHYSRPQCLDSINLTTTAIPLDDGSPYRAHTSISLPIFAEELSFVARGDLSRGTFQISQSLDVDSEAIVDVTVLYHQPEVLNNAMMCRLHSPEGKWGFGIFTPNWFSTDPEQKIQVDIHVRLPADVDPRKPLFVKQLRTYLPQYKHIIQNLSESVHFGTIRLTSQDGGVSAENLRADSIKVGAGVGPITGTYNASNVLVLDTANAPIAVRANLLGGGEGHVVRLYMKTSNSFIDGQIGLYSNASDAAGGAFTVNARTANSPLKLAVVDAPVDSTLFASAATSNSPAQVKLHETYEGSFSLLSSRVFRPVVEWNEDAEDPAGRGRERTVKVNAVKDSLVTGDVFWGKSDAKERPGTVSVETSNSPLRLVL